jgi:tetratricopeptide (TPR) repeat protein
VALSVALFLARKRFPAGLAAWTIYLLTLIPVSGLVPFGRQLAADRYTYLSLLGAAVLAGAGLGRLLRTPAMRTVALVGAAVALAALALMTQRQIGVWRDGETLWSYVVGIEPRHAFANCALGTLDAGRGRLDEAERRLRVALQTDPEYAEAHNNLGIVLNARGRAGEAVQHYEAALRIKPAYADAHFNLANALVAAGSVDEGIAHARRAIELDPGRAAAHVMLGAALFRKGDTAGARDEFRAALRLDPTDEMARQNLMRVGG